MKAEKVILSFVAIVIGLVAASAAFYFYQMTKTLPKEKAQIEIAANKKVTPSPTPDRGNFLTIDEPTDEGVFDKKIIAINGKTEKNATIIVTSEDADQIVKPAANGDFSLSQNIPDGTSILYITAIFPNGEEKQVTKTVTYTTETF